MILLAAASVAALLVFGFLLFKFYQFELRQTQLKGISCLQILRQLLSDVQRHRGLTSAYLSGDTYFIKDVLAVQKDVLRDFYQLANTEPEFEALEEWQNITNHWSKLTANFRRVGFERSYTQHTMLVKSIITLMLRTTFLYKLDKTGLGRRVPQGFSRYFSRCTLLLECAEYIGQARGLGMSVLVSNQSNVKIMSRVFALSSTIRDSISMLWRSQSPSPLEQAKVESFLETLECLTNPLDTSVVPDHFFSQASDLMEIFYAEYDAIITALGAYERQQLKKLNKTMQFSFSP